VYTENGCPSDSSGTIVFNSLIAHTYAFGNEGIWPVPSTDKIWIQTSLMANSMEIFDLRGVRVDVGWNLIQKNVANANGFISEIKIENLASGQYFIQINTEKGSKEFRFSKP
jgi:hypothetical protein